jgi:uncharacterized repeat protein (TIGR01451 family)
MNHKKIIIFAFSALIVLGVALLVAVNSLAVNGLDLFELDRNAIDDPLVPGDDWSTLYTGGGNAEAFTGILPDIGADGGTQFTGGGSKDISDITDWLWKPGEPLDKDDITNAYAAAYRNTREMGQNHVGDLIIYFGLDRYAVNGSAQVGFWFLQDPNFGLTDTSSKGGYKFSGVHMDNDVLVQSNFSNGGVISRITVYKWSSGALEAVYDAAECSPTTTGDVACAIVNQSATDSPWPYTPKTGPSDIFPTSAFFEGGINISNLIPDVGCFTGFIAETRSSTPFTSQLKDFVTGNFSLCRLQVDKTGSTLSKIGDTASYTVTITNTGALTLYQDVIADTLLGDITIDGVDQSNSYVLANSCGASLAPDASCEITLEREVQEGDPDPLPNTVTAIYRGKSDLSGIAISDSDDHEVNLFQPSIELAKTGDDLSKIGDTVDYTITLTNTSSADTPDLTCTITDTLVDVDVTFSIGSGDDPHVINVSGFTIPEDADDPFVNTAYVMCSPAGFPNVYRDNAQWSTNLFQPSIDLAKTGDELSKIGDDVDYTITLTNDSSADTPDLTCTITDTLVDVDVTFSIGSGDDPHVINVSGFTIPEDADDPFVNTAYVMCSPAGFPNVYRDNAQWSTNLFQPSVSLTKECDALSKIGDTISCDVTIENTSSADSPDLILDSFTDSLVSSVTPPAACNPLAPAATCHVLYDYVVQAGDPDPLSNKATAHFHPYGFLNDIWDDDTWETNLFQPAVQVIKSGPNTAGRGDTVTYGFTINNQSSADSPNLILDSVIDSRIGNLSAIASSNGCGTLAPSGSCSFTADYTIQNTDPNPLVNVVTVLYHPSGFPNHVTDDDTHSLTMPNQGCTPGFWQGGAGSPLWDEVDDPQWIYNGSNPFIHDTLFNDFFNVSTDSRLDGLTMYDLVSGGGGDDWAVKAARDMVAAYLNESAFPDGYPAASLTNLTDRWYAAVNGGDATLQGFHDLVSGWNSPPSPGYCPLP